MFSIKKKNLSRLKRVIEQKWGIKCYVRARRNGYGNKYYEFNINKKADVAKIKPYLSKENQMKLVSLIK